MAHILVFPFPAQGHMLPLLDLAHHLSSATAVTVVVTTKNLPLLSPLLFRSPSITPLVLPFPDHPSIPPGVENIKDLPLLYFSHMMSALAGLHQPLLQWARSHPSPPSAIISDWFLGWTNSLAEELHIPRLVFSPSGALTLSIIHCLWRDMLKPTNTDDLNSTIVFPSVPGSPIYPWYQLSLVYRCYRAGEPLWEFVRDGFLANMNSFGYVFNTFDELEGRYLEHLKADHRVWAVGPLCSPADTSAERGGAASVPAAEVMAWLDQFEEGKVVYVCFGTQAMLSPPQAAAVAAGLEKSGVKFVWSVKGTTVVPEGLDERVEGRGRVIRGWAPQVAILGHGAVGWFLTHCGWNSTVEAAAAGVAMLTWPMTADQYMDARLLEEEAGVGVRVCEGRSTVPEPDELARVLAGTVGRGERPEMARAAELKRKAAEAVAEGGSSTRDLAALVEELTTIHVGK